MPQGDIHFKTANAAVDLSIPRVAHGSGSIVSGTPTMLADGREIADDYTLTVSAVALGSPNTFTITVTTGLEGNPYNGAVWTLVEGGSTRDDIIPGVDVTFSTSGSTANGWNSTVSVGIALRDLVVAGNPAGTQEQWTTAVYNPGSASVTSGDPQFLGKFLAVNTGAETLADCKIIFHPRAKRYVTQTPNLFEYTQTVDDTPAERVSGGGQTLPLKFRAANLDTGTTPDEIDIEYAEDGSTFATFDCQDVDTGDAITSVNLARDGTTRYQITESGAKAEGLIFVISAAATNASTENVLIFNKRHVWFALDNAGAPGTWTQDEVVLTQSGESTGIIQPAGSVVVWVKWDVGSLASNAQNPFPGDLSAEYALTGVADWEG
jgi:hypothetical protein